MTLDAWLIAAASALDLDTAAMKRALDWSDRSAANVRTRERIVVYLRRNATKKRPLTTREIGDLLGGDQASVSKAYKRARERATAEKGRA